MSNAATAYVVTHHWVPNFGANLQAVGTAAGLAQRGIAARFVDFRPRELVQKYTRSVPCEQLAVHEEFVRENLDMTRSITCQPEFEALAETVSPDFWVTGSDAVFRLESNSDRADLTFPNPYWLVGIRNPASVPARKVAVSPSAMGVKFLSLPAHLRHDIRKALEDFQSISVRDQWTRRQLQAVGYELHVPLMPDPVFLLRDRIIDVKKCSSDFEEPYIVLSTGGCRKERWIRAFTACAESQGVATVAVPTPEGMLDKGTTYRVDLPLSPWKWVNILAQSIGYVGVRFHPIVVCLLAGVPVVSLDLYHSGPHNRSRSKTWLLLREVGLEGACYGHRLHPLLTPRRTWNELDAQRSDEDKRATIIAGLCESLHDYFDLAFGGRV